MELLLLFTYIEVDEMEEFVKQLNADFDPRTAALSVVVGLCQFLIYFVYVKFRGPKDHTPEGRKILSKIKDVPFYDWGLWNNRKGIYVSSALNSPKVTCETNGEVTLGNLSLNKRINRKDRSAIRAEVRRIIREKDVHCVIDHNNLLDKQIEEL